MTRMVDQILQQHAFLQGLSPVHVADLCALAREVTFEEDEVILMEGQLSSAFYLLCSGSVSIARVIASRTASAP